MKKYFAPITAAVVALYSLSAVFAAGTFIPELDVNGLKVTPYNGSVLVEWDEVEDYDGSVDGYDVWYDTEEVEDGGTYAFTEDAGDADSYLIEGLSNGTKYYFSVTAYDSEGNESKNWALPESSATPKADLGNYNGSNGGNNGGGSDTTAPRVSSAEAVSKTKVKVEFSEAVVLPDEDAEDEFTIEDENFVTLEVLSAELDEDDDDNKTVILETEEQEELMEYTLIVGTGVEDEAGNVIISGTSDTAIFEGSGSDGDTDSPRIEDVEVMDATHVFVHFNESVVLDDLDPTSNFEIYAEDDAFDVLEVKDVSLGVNTDQVANASALLTTAEQEEITYVVEVSGVTDVDGNEIDSAYDSETFEGAVAGGDDDDDEDSIFDAEDVANFLAKQIMDEDGEGLSVKLSWDVIEDNIGVVEQILYMSANMGEEYDKEASLEADEEEYTVNGLEAGEYWFKVTQVDEEGNETEGSVTKVILTETGPGMAGLLLASLGLGRVVSRKKRK